jgi:hypothetical protein
MVIVLTLSFLRFNSKTQIIILPVLVLHVWEKPSWMIGITCKNHRRKVGVAAASNRAVFA